ncbi:hypothetical protein GCM10010372_69980 [Streptomyces tauricus]|nr:hypothetical protein GCM10010372_69980 [Streptomyces tauricus]
MESLQVGRTCPAMLPHPTAGAPRGPTYRDAGNHAPSPEVPAPDDARQPPASRGAGNGAPSPEVPAPDDVRQLPAPRGAGNCAANHDGPAAGRLPPAGERRILLRVSRC